jgi:hypothetical protein
MSSKTIAFVKPQGRPWTSSYGPMVSIDGGFDDGEGFSVNCKPENEEKLKATLEGLVNKPIEGFTVEPAIDKKTNRQREFQGRLQWNLKAVQANGFGGGFKGGGGGKTWTESYAQSKECKETEQRSIQRSVALEKAHQFHVAFAGLSNEAVTPQAILATAEIYADWLGKQPDTSQEYRTWVTWMENKVKVKFFTSKEDAWKNAMTYANEMGYDHLRLKTCTDHSIFKKIQDKLEAPTHPRNGNVQQPNAYQRQPAYSAPEDDSLPF